MTTEETFESLVTAIEYICAFEILTELVVVSLWIYALLKRGQLSLLPIYVKAIIGLYILQTTFIIIGMIVMLLVL